MEFFKKACKILFSILGAILDFMTKMLRFYATYDLNELEENEDKKEKF